MSRLDALRKLRTDVTASTHDSACWAVLSHNYKACSSEECKDCIYEESYRPRPGPTLEETIRITDELKE